MYLYPASKQKNPQDIFTLVTGTFDNLQLAFRTKSTEVIKEVTKTYFKIYLFF